MNAPLDQYDIAIVGAGVAGCYTAYRLAHATVDNVRPDSPLYPILQERALRIGLFEYSGRVGGRLRSQAIPQASGGGSIPYVAEFGGFRFNDEMHIVSDLVEHLKLGREPFYVSEDENFVYVRGQQLDYGKLNSEEFMKANPDYVPYNLAPEERGLTPDALSNLVCEAALPGFSAMHDAYRKAYDAEQWAEVQRLTAEFETAVQETEYPTGSGHKLPDWDWWSLMSDVLSQEAIALMEDTGGYNSLASQGNMQNSFVEPFYSPSDPDWHHVTGLAGAGLDDQGYDQIPTQLQKQFDPDGERTFRNYQLLSFDKTDGGYELTFYERQPGPKHARSTVAAQTECAETADACRTTTATHLILALPQRALELLDQDNFFFQGQLPRPISTYTTVQELLGSVSRVQAFRMFMAYSEPWWTKAGVSKGRSTTDLPVRQMYYWWTSPEDAAECSSLTLASYCNGRAQGYWQGLEPLLSSLSAVPDKGGPREPTNPAGSYAAPPNRMSDLAHDQLQKVNQLSADGPYYAHFQDWGKDPWGGGWHAWHAGSNQNAVIPAVRQPLPAEQVYIVGEAFSNVQGWVQGALNTSEAMLQDHLKLAWPGWLQKGGTWLGPRLSD